MSLTKDPALESAKFVDTLTGLFNRQYLYITGENLYQNAKRGKVNLSVILLDIDNLMEINENYGTSAGDIIIKTISGVFKENLRKADIITRFEEDKFCILLNVKQYKESISVIEKIRKIVESKEYVFNNKTLKTTISCGVSIDPGASFDDMINYAELLLDKAKKNGGNQVCV